jgi:hypothetical protein
MVSYGGHLYPRSLFDGSLDPPPKPGDCVHCGGSGVRVESIDEDLHDAVVPCFACQEYCKTCKRYRKKGGHKCRP